MTPSHEPDAYELQRRAINDVLEARDEARGRTFRRGDIKGGIWLELAKLTLAALVAGGSAYLSMDHRLTAVETELRSLKDSMADVKTTLGIGVYQGSKR